MQSAPHTEGRSDDRRRPHVDQLRSRGTAGDALATFYSAVADDSGQVAQTREAALLFTVAEGHFKDGGSADHEEAARAAEAAFAAARAGEDGDLWADAARLVVKSRCLRAYNIRYERGSGGAAEADDLLAKARSFAEGQRHSFKVSGFLRGQAAMRLSVAEVYLEEKNLDERASAVKPALEASTLFQQLGDKKLEAAALLVLSDAYALEKDRRKSQEAAEAARSLFRLAEDRAGEARALHAVAMVSAMEGSYACCDSGLRLAQEAMSLFGEAGCRGLQATELLVIADFNLNLGRPKQALLASKEALHIFRQIGYGRGFESVALGMVVESHIEHDALNSAVDVAKDAVSRFSKLSDRRQEVVMQDVLTHACLEMGDTDAALDAVKAGLALCSELQDHSLEANLLLTLSEVQFKLDRFDDALISAQDASSIFRALDHEWQLAGFAQYQVAKICAATADIDKALEESHLARDFFYKINNHRCEGLALLQAASIIGQSQSRLDEAIKVSEQAQDIFEKVEDKGGQAFALFVCAELHRAAENYPVALEKARSRRKLVQELGFSREEAKALHTIAVVCLASQDPAEGSRAAREGLRLARVAGDKVTEVHMLLQVVECNIQLAADADDPEKQQRLAEDALKTSRDAVAISRKVAAGRLRAPALFWNAYALNICGSSGEASEIVEDALRLFRAARNRASEAHTILLCAKVQYSRGKVNKAEDLCNAALELFIQIGDAEGQTLASEVLRRVAPSAEQRQQQQQQQQQQQDEQQQQQLQLDEAASGAVKAAAAPKGLDLVAARRRIMKIAVDTIGDDEGVEFDSPLMDMGLDSLSSVSLRNELVKEFKMSLAASVMFDYPSVQSLSDHIVEKNLN